MPLSCSCDFDPEPGDWYYSGADLDIQFPDRRRVRCACPECMKLLSPGDTVSKYYRVKVPNTLVECAIYGEDGEVPMAPDYLCEECSDLLAAFDELGFCVGPRESLRELAKQWSNDYGPKRAAY